MADPTRPIDDIPPQDIDAELYLLSTAMHGPDGVDALYKVEASDFYRYRPVYEAAMQVIQEGKVVTRHSIAHVMRRSRYDEDWILQVAHIDMAAAGTTNADLWAEAVVAASVRRRVNEFTLLAQSAVQDRELSLDDLRETLQSQFFEAISRASTEKRQFEASEVAPVVLKAIEDRYDGLKPLAGLATGLVDLDYYRKLMPGNLVIIAGRTSMGKTCLALTMALSIARDGGRVLYFSTEMEKDELHERLISMRSNAPYTELQHGSVLPYKRADVRAAGEGNAKLNLTIDGTASPTPAYIMAQIRKFKVMGKLDAVFADHIHRMQPDRRTQNDVEKYGQIAQGLKTAARTFGVPVIAMAQMSRAADARPDKEPILTDIRGSGTIEEEADTILFVYRPAYYEKKKVADRDERACRDILLLPEDADIIVHKNRSGRTGKVPVIFVPACVRFDTKAKEYETAGYGPVEREESAPAYSTAQPTLTANSTAVVADDPFAEEPDEAGYQDAGLGTFFQGVNP